MAERSVFTDGQIQDYIDGRLNARDRAAVAGYLLAHARVAAEVEAVRRQSEALQALGQEILDEPVPERLREVLRARPRRRSPGLRPVAPPAARPRRRAPRFVEAAAALLLLGAGGALGWFAHGVVAPLPNLDDALLADMSRAYLFYGARDYPVAFPPERAAELVGWIGRSFQRDVRPPDLSAFGYSYRGGRLIPGAGSPLGLFQFARAEYPELAVFFWTTAAPPPAVRELDERGDIAARFWTTDGLSFAVISDKAQPDLETTAQAVFAFYDSSFGPQLTGSAQ